MIFLTTNKKVLFDRKAFLIMSTIFLTVSRSPKVMATEP